MSQHYTCTICGKECAEDRHYLVEGDILCCRCTEEETTICAHCGERIYCENNRGDESTPLCTSCYDSYYLNCSHCGRVIRIRDARYSSDDEDEEVPYCANCLPRISRHRTIQDYYYKPDPVFYGTGPRFFGIELEIDEGGEDNWAALEILKAASSVHHERIYIKRDGSLSEGMEVVSHPLSLDYHMKEMPWKVVFDKAKSLGYVSHQTRTCGLHIHVSRAAFGKTVEEQEACIARILYFFEKHWEELLKFSRRTPQQLERWAARYGYKDTPKELLDHAKNRNAGRYTSVNLTNANTIEFRMFRGTLKLSTFLATLQLVDQICNVALFMSDEDIRAMSWTTFVSGCCDRPELVQYLKERRLYINEPVNGEVEI